MTSYVSELPIGLAERVQNYLDRFGFQRDGEWYARASWLGEHWLALLKQMGVMTRIGNGKDLRMMGIQVPPGDDKATAVFYRFNPEAVSSIKTH